MDDDPRFQSKICNLKSSGRGLITSVVVEVRSTGGYDVDMSVATFKIGQKEFVVLPRRRYERLTRAEQDQKDAEIARKGREAFLAGKIKTISHDALKRKLGL